MPREKAATATLEPPAALAPVVHLPADAELREMSTERLHQLLTGLVELSVAVLEFGARVWRILQGRDEDLSEYRHIIFTRVRQIACNTLLPEVPVAFGLQSPLFTHVSRMLPDDQRKLSAEGATVPVAVRDEHGGWTHTNVLVRHLQTSHLPLVFNGSSVRTVEQQVAYLTQTLPEWKPSKRDEIRVDRAKGKLWIGKTEASLERVCAALRRAGIKKLG